MFLTKLENGDYRPTYSSDSAESAKIGIGTEVKATRARNAKHHRKGMALLKLGFDNQDTFTDFTIYRYVVTMKAGFVAWVKGTDGNDHPLPKSISFENMSQSEFEDYYSAVLTVILKEADLTDEQIQTELINFM